MVPPPLPPPLPCYVVLPSSAWSSSWSLPSPCLPLFVAFGPPIVLHSCYMSGPSPLLFQCVFYNINYLGGGGGGGGGGSWYPSMVSYLVALDLAFSSLLLFEWFSVCLPIVYWETIFDSHRSLLARHIGPLLDCFVVVVFSVRWGVVYLGIFPCLFFFPKTAPGCSDPGLDFFCTVFEVCGLSEVFEFKFSPDVFCLSFVYF